MTEELLIIPYENPEQSEIFRKLNKTWKTQRRKSKKLNPQQCIFVGQWSWAASWKVNTWLGDRLAKWLLIAYRKAVFLSFDDDRPNLV